MGLGSVAVCLSLSLWLTPRLSLATSPILSLAPSPSLSLTPTLTLAPTLILGLTLTLTAGMLNGNGCEHSQNPSSQSAARCALIDEMLRCEQG